MTRAFLWNPRGDVSRRWHDTFAGGAQVHGIADLAHGLGRVRDGLAEVVARGGRNGRRGTLWVDFDLFDAHAGQIAAIGMEHIVALDLAPSAARARRAFRLRAHGYCHALAAPELLRRVAASVERGELWIGRELAERITELAGKAAVPA